jgi:hypothetical protein
VAGSPGATGPTGPQGPAGPMGVGLGTVVDNLGQVIGTLQSTSAGFSNVIMSVNGQSVVVQLGSAGFVLSNNIYFFHQGPNCAGPRYFSVGDWFVNNTNNYADLIGPLDLGSIPPLGEIQYGASYIVYEQTPLQSPTFCGVCPDCGGQCATETNDGNTDSIEGFNGSDPSQPGGCSGVHAETQITGSFASPGFLPLSSFQPPFALQ